MGCWFPTIITTTTPPAALRLTGCFFYPKVPSVEKVLKALAGLPRSDFAEMIRQVGGVGVQRGGRSGACGQPRLRCSAPPLSLQGNGTFNSIPELAVERMAQVIQGEWDGWTEWGPPPWGESQFGDIEWDVGTIQPSSMALALQICGMRWPT